MRQASYIRSLDGLRAVSILIVLTGDLHWGYPHLGHAHAQLGVIVFFVISGFVITRILLAAKGEDAATYLRTFYVRRSLRIFPLYYAYLVVGWALAALLRHSSGATFSALSRTYYDNWATLWTYTYNFKPLADALAHRALSLEESVFGHLWSLSVEEQFYIFFPFLVYALPRRALAWAMGALLVAAPLLRLGLFAWLQEDFGADYIILINYKLTPTNLDALLTGGLLAMGLGASLRRPDLWLAASALALLALLNLPAAALPGGWGGHLLNNAAYIGTYLGTEAVAALGILACMRGSGWAERLLGSRLMVSIGRVTYGMYIWHLLVVLALHLLVHRLHLKEWIDGNALAEAGLFLAYLAFLYGLCQLSYRWLEMPFLRLKDRWAPPASPPARS